MKRLITLVLVLLMMVMLLAVPAGAVSENGGYHDILWNYNAQTKTLTLTGTGEMPEPQILDEYPWSRYHDRTEHLKISEGITTIGWEAFQNFHVLKDVSLPGSLKQISGFAFEDCESLKRITIPEGVEKIGDGAFKDCIFLKEALLPDRLCSLGRYAFSGCKHLEHIDLPEGMIRIQPETFAECISLKTVSLPSMLEEIQFRAFSGCSSLQGIDIPESVAEIGAYAFAGCASLRGVDLPESLAVIGDKAFYRCRDLVRITIPKDIKQIMPDTFGLCRSLQEVELPEGLETIHEGAFFGCRELETVLLPKSLRTLEKNAFGDCTSLTRVEFFRGKLIIGREAFYGCGELPEVERYIFMTQLVPWMILGLVTMGAMTFVVFGGCRQNALGFRRTVVRRTTIVLTAVALGCLLGLLWDKLGLNKAGHDYGILLYWLAGFVPEPYRKLAMDWADQIYLWIYILLVTVAVAAYQFYVGRCWIRALGKPGWVLVSGTGLCIVWYLAPDLWDYLEYCIGNIHSLADLFDSYNSGGIMPILGFLLGHMNLLIWGLRSRKQGPGDRKYLPSRAAGCFAAVSVGLTAILGSYLLGTAGKKLWQLIDGSVLWWTLGITAVSCILWTLWRSRKRIKEWFVELQPRIGKAVRIGIIVAAIVAGYCVFSVQVNGNFQSEYYAEQITVVHYQKDSDDKTMYCVDFTERELRYYVLHSNGYERLSWTKELTDEALDAFVETCNDAELLGRPCYAYLGHWSSTDDTYCKIYTYSVRGERLVFDGLKHYENKEVLIAALDKAFYDLTGYRCLTDS